MSPLLRRWAIPGVAFALALAAAHALDGPAHVALRAADAPLAESKDWYRLLRIMGYGLTWLGVGVALVLLDGPRSPAPGSRWHWPSALARGPFLAGSALGAGLLAEGLKLVIRRARPEHPGAGDDGLPYAFAPWSAGWDSSDFGLPSSHAAVAFGAAFALAHLLPRLAPLLMLWAVGCAWTRLLSGDHYLSDVILGAAVGYLVPTVITALHERARTPGRSGTGHGRASAGPAPAREGSAA